MNSSVVPESGVLRPVDLDPALVNSVGLHHSLPTAIADLVDNSLDAGASEVLIRLLLSATAPIGIQVIDNGCGMDDVAVDRAMTYAGTREYRQSDLGHFGVGLKAASLSQADTVLVYSRADESAAVARKLVRSRNGGPPQVGVVSGDEAAARLDDAALVGPEGTGTIIEWRDVRTFPSTGDDDERARWMQGALADIRSHLGLVLHRIVARDTDADSGADNGFGDAGAARSDVGRCGGGNGAEQHSRTVGIRVGTGDLARGEEGTAREVTPIDPFGYRRSGDGAFPEKLEIDLPDGSEPVRAIAHIWPAGSQEPGFKIGGDPGGDHQGFFVYRRNRLIQAGGWGGLWANRPDWALARVALDLTAAADAHVTINPEKSGLELSADLRRGIESAICRPSGLTFTQYLERAAGEDRAGRTRTRHPVAVTEPAGGLPASVLYVYEDAVEMRRDVDSVDIRWLLLPTDRVFMVDVDERELQLNAHYRDVIVGHHSLDPNDAPVVKVLLHLLTEQYLAGAYLGDRAKRKIAAWNAVLLSAVKAQEAAYARQAAVGRHSRESGE